MFNPTHIAAYCSVHRVLVHLIMCSVLLQPWHNVQHCASSRFILEAISTLSKQLCDDGMKMIFHFLYIDYEI